MWSVSARRRLFQQAAEFWALGRSFFDGATPAETRRGQELVRERFLLTRLIADELRLYGDLLGTRQPRSAVTKAGLTGEERDPVCGMHLDPAEALEYEYAGRAHRFCSETCRQQFESTPEPFLRAIA